MTDISQKQGGWTPGLSGAPTDGTLFLAWAVTPTYDEDECRTVMVEEPVIAQVVFGEAMSVPLHSMPQGRLLTHWQPVQRPSRANPSTDQGGE